MVINDIFQEYWDNKSQIEISIQQMKEELGDMAERIVLYGAAVPESRFSIICVM